MATEAIQTVQMKVSGLMCSFCNMSIEKVVKRYPSVKSVLVEADMAKISREELAAARSIIDTEVSL